MKDLIAPSDAGRHHPSRLGLGCASAWGQEWFDEAKALAIVQRAIELGITVFDTGPSYSNGHAEPRLGKALRRFDSRGLQISTKVGTHIGRNGKLFHDLSRDIILKSIEASRQRLALDTIPLLYLHGPRLNELDAKLADALLEMRQRGWVGELGVNSFDTPVLEALIDVPWVNVVMLDYNVIRPDREDLIDRLESAGKRIVAGAAVANNLFAPKFLRPKSMSDLWYAARALKNYRGELVRARRISALSTCPGWSKTQVALAFVLSNRKVDTAMFSTTRIEHLEENAKACELELPQAIAEEIRAESALAASRHG